MPLVALMYQQKDARCFSTLTPHLLLLLGQKDSLIRLNQHWSAGQCTRQEYILNGTPVDHCGFLFLGGGRKNLENLKETHVHTGKTCDIPRGQKPQLRERWSWEETPFSTPRIMNELYSGGTLSLFTWCFHQFFPLEVQILGLRQSNLRDFI